MGIQVRDPKTGQLVPLRDMQLVQETERLKTSVQSLSAEVSSVNTDIESIKNQMGQLTAILDGINGEVI